MATVTETASPFHAGERAVQTRMGVRERIEAFARQVVRPFLPDEHRQFYSSLPFIVAAARDADDRPWVTLLAGQTGFISSETATELQIDAEPATGDALHGQLGESRDIGLLGIEFATRRRNRVNGRIRSSRSGLRVQVDQSFGNCPQYIQPREWLAASSFRASSAIRSDRLTAQQSAWIRESDTFFIATGHRGGSDAACYGMDASHRGGESGFVEVTDKHTLQFPDYSGNNHFNTIGNLVEDPRVGLLFVDFAGGHLLQLSGRAEIDWDSPAVEAIPGARRLISIQVEAVVEVRDALPICWAPVPDGVRSMVAVGKVVESADVTSFELAPRDGNPLPEFEPGQHLPIEVNIAGQRHGRTYSLSAAPDPNRYRLSIKRDPQGLMSRYLHDQFQIGDSLTASDPAGEFTLESGRRPVVLVSAGVGVTPMMSMLAQLVGKADERPVWFIHGARDGKHHPLAQEASALGSLSDHVTSHVSYSQPNREDLLSVDYHRHGRVDAELVCELLGDLRDVDVYLCGPLPFMAQLRDGLSAAGVPERQIYFETFGPGA